MFLKHGANFLSPFLFAPLAKGITGKLMKGKTEDRKDGKRKNEGRKEKEKKRNNEKNG